MCKLLVFILQTCSKIAFENRKEFQKVCLIALYRQPGAAVDGA
jgi:hypothetical protein